MSVEKKVLTEFVKGSSARGHALPLVSAISRSGVEYCSVDLTSRSLVEKHLNKGEPTGLMRMLI